MHTGKLVFAHLMEHLPPMVFERCVARYGGNHKVQSFACMDQYLCMAFAHLTFRESLRDIEACLRSQAEKPYHMGIRGQVSRNTLANANATRDWRIYADFAQRLIGIARKLYVNEPFGVDLSNTAYALDSTTIDLSLSLFPWAPFRTTKAAVKMHTLLDLRGNIPSFIHISDCKLHDVNILDQLIPETAGLLRHGSRLHRLPALVSAASGRQLLCHPRNAEHGRAAALFASRGPIHGSDLRPDAYAGWLSIRQGLSRELSRRRSPHHAQWVDRGDCRFRCGFGTAAASAHVACYDYGAAV
jgi:hypothetical protein